jgi:hypothetical protein
MAFWRRQPASRNAVVFLARRFVNDLISCCIALSSALELLICNRAYSTVLRQRRARKGDQSEKARAKHALRIASPSHLPRHRMCVPLLGALHALRRPDTVIGSWWQLVVIGRVSLHLVFLASQHHNSIFKGNVESMLFKIVAIKKGTELCTSDSLQGPTESQPCTANQASRLSASEE